MTTTAPEGPVRDRILSIAAELFWRKSFAGTTTRELAEALGIRKASLYHHIRSKDDLLYDLSVRAIEKIETLVRAAAEAAPAVERLDAAMRAHLTVALEERAMFATMLTELRSMSPERRKEVTGRRDAYEKVLFDLIVDDQQEGRLRHDIEPRLLTLSLLNLTNWSIFWWRDDGEQSAEDLAEVLSKQFFDGARPR